MYRSQAMSACIAQTPDFPPLAGGGEGTPLYVLHTESGFPVLGLPTKRRQTDHKSRFTNFCSNLVPRAFPLERSVAHE